MTEILLAIGAVLVVVGVIRLAVDAQGRASRRDAKRRNAPIKHRGRIDRNRL